MSKSPQCKVRIFGRISLNTCKIFTNIVFMFCSCIRTFSKLIMMKLSTAFLSIAASAILVSCIGDGGFKSKYNEYCSFEFSNVTSLYGPDSLYFETDFPSPNQALAFRGERITNGLNGETIDNINDFRGGFILSLLRDTKVCEGHIEQDEHRSKYSTVADTTGADNSKGFAIFKYLDGYMPAQSVSFLYTAYGTCMPKLMSVCNTNYVVNTVLYGNSYCRAFETGDYIKLTIKAYLDGAQSGETVEVKLVDYAESDLKIIDSWKRVDISKLGDFDYLIFEMSSNVPSAPLYCCVDGMLCSVDIEN